MSHFVGHEPCPKCGSKDNLGRYADGGAFCFGCGYVEGRDRIALEPTRKVTRALPSDLTTLLPPANRKWLQRFLDDSEIDEYFEYSPSLDRHIFRWYQDDGFYWEARSVNNVQPKTLSHGTKPNLYLGRGESTTLVIVEDIVSAIKVGRFCRSYPLFGAYLSATHRGKIIGDDFSEVIVWLDRDKMMEAVVISTRFQPFVKSRVVSTTKDPKECSEKEILEQIT